MGNLAQVDELLALLRGVGLDVLKRTDVGDSTAARDALLEGEILEAESWAEGFAGRRLIPMSQVLDVVSGRQTPMIRLTQRPILVVDSLVIQLDPLQFGQRTFSESQLRVDKAKGLVSIKQNAFLAIGLPSIVYFPHGSSNIQVLYRTGWGVIGNNMSSETIMTEGYPEVAMVYTSGDYTYFRCPRPYSAFKSGELLSARGAQVMLRDGVDVSSLWSMSDNRTLQIASTSYAAASKYVFAYVPAAIGQAVVKAAAAGVMTRKGAQSDPGSSDGVTSRQIGPFGEDYGEMQYAGQIKRWMQDAQDLLQPYRCSVVGP